MTAVELYQARKELKLTQTQLGDKLGLSREHVTRMETGSRPLQASTAKKVQYLLAMCKISTK